MAARVSSPIDGASNPLSPDQSGNTSSSGTYIGSSFSEGSSGDGESFAGIYSGSDSSSGEEEEEESPPQPGPAADVQISGNSAPINATGLRVISDPDMLDSSICVSPLSSPVSQSGHTSSSGTYTGSSGTYSCSSYESSSGEEEEPPRPGPAADVQISGNSAHATSLPVIYDPDMLDCPICVSPLSPPVFQCENGHVACQSCCGRMSNKCPSCKCPTGHVRCRWAERFLESLKVSCKYWEQGCMEKMSHSVKCDHERSCAYDPFLSCPHHGCDFIGTSECLYTHFAEKHRKTSRKIRFGTTISFWVGKHPKNVFLRKRSERTLFVLDHSVRPRGRLLKLVCIGNTSSKNKFSYELTATAGDNTVTFNGIIVEQTPKFIQQPRVGTYLMVPKSFVSSGLTRLKLTIRRGVV